MVIERIKQIVVKELIQALRDRRTRVFMIMPPLIQLALFGYIVTMEVRNVPTALFDLDRSSQSREVARRLTANGYFNITHAPSSDAEMTGLLDRGEVSVGLKIDGDFSRDLATGKTAKIQAIVDGSDSNTAIIALGYLTKMMNAYGAELRPFIGQGAIRVIEFRPNFRYNPELRSRNYYVPGVIASIIMITCVMLTSMAVVKEREAGTMEQLMVTPVSHTELILGKTVPFALIGFFDLVLVTVVGVLLFDIPIKGSLFMLFLGTAVYLMSILGVGLFISTIAKTQQQAMMAAMLFNMPAILLAGFVFPIESMSDFFQYLTYLNPLRHFLVIIRGVFLKGAGLNILWPQVLMLAGLGTAILALSAMRFKKRLK